MAASKSLHSNAIEPSQRDKEEGILAVQLAQTPDNDEGFRPLLADAQKIGFFSLDRTTQTNTTEILTIKELTETIEQLLEDSANMRRDINFARSVMQAEFDAKLERKAIELYHRVNEKINDLEKMQEERVMTVRRAFRQQLSDALVRVQSLYHQNMDEKISREKKKKDKERDRWLFEIKQLQKTIQQNEEVIEALQQEVSQLQEKEEDMQSHQSKSSRAPSTHNTAALALEEEVDDMRREMKKLDKQIEYLQDEVDSKDKENEKLSKQVNTLNRKMEKDKIMLEQLTQEKDDLMSRTIDDQHSSKQALEEARVKWEREMHERTAQARQEALAEARKELRTAGAGDQELIKRLMDEKRMMEQLLAKERGRADEVSQDQRELARAKNRESTLLSQVNRLKREIDRVHKTWEKKFAILQQSLHALKDESYLRQSMQKQAVQLHQASVSYAMDTPKGIVPFHPPSAGMPTSPKKPLPNIKSDGGDKHGRHSPPDYISYTISAPSGRATTLFSAEEDQVMSGDEEDLPEDVMVLPAPPDVFDSRPSTQSHSIVVPNS